MVKRYRRQREVTGNELELLIAILFGLNLRRASWQKLAASQHITNASRFLAVLGVLQKYTYTFVCIYLKDDLFPRVFLKAGGSESRRSSHDKTEPARAYPVALNDGDEDFQLSLC